MRMQYKKRGRSEAGRNDGRADEGDQHTADEEDQRGGSAYLEVLVQEVEEQQDGDQEGQGEGRCHAN